MDRKYKVKEIFGPTLQGEGSYTGGVCMFVRFTGCNLWSGKEEHKPSSVCYYCDTDFVGGDLMTADDIIRKILNLCPETSVIVLSGGEPMLQVDKELCVALVDAGYSLHLETNGTKSTLGINQYLEHVTCSPKQSILDTKLECADDLKILYPFPRGVSYEDFRDKFPYNQGFIQPIHGPKYDLNLKDSVEYIFKNKELRLSLQTHKITGVE